MTPFLGLLVIAAAVYAVARRVDVRLVLLPAALLLGLLAGQPAVIVQTFLSKLADPASVVPICCAMGFAYVLRQTGCDEHLIQLLTKPIRRVRVLLIPGTVLVGFLVNIPIISQTAAVVAVGSILVPLLTAARISLATTGSALLLGASIGGELLNPGAPEYRTITSETLRITGQAVTGAVCVRNSLPLVLTHLAVALLIFWVLSLRHEAREIAARTEEQTAPTEAVAAAPSFRVNLLKAAIPLLPLAILFLTAEPYGVIHLKPSLLVDVSKEFKDLLPGKAEGRIREAFDSRLIGAAMLVGVLAATLTTLWTAEDRKLLLGTAKAFFDGTGYAFKEVIALIVVANCFAKGVELIGIGELIGHALSAVPALLVPAACFLPLGMAFVSGSGIGPTQGLFQFFAVPAHALGVDAAAIGSLVALGSAAGRTMSPVAAVNAMCVQLTSTPAATLVRRVAPPLLLGIVVTLLLRSLL